MRKAIPKEDLLSKLAHIRRMGWVNMHNIEGVKDAAEQLGWKGLVKWIEEEIEIGSGHNHDYETYLKAITAAATGDEKVIQVKGTFYIQVDFGGEMRIRA